MLQLGLFDPPELTELVSSLPDTPANRLVTQESGKGKTTTVISGLKCIALSESFGLAGLFLKTWMGMSVWDSQRLSLTWKPRAIPSSDRLLYQLVPPARRTKGTGSSSPASHQKLPQTQDPTNSNDSNDTCETSTMWRTPQAHNGAQGAQGAKSREFYEHCQETGQSMITLVDQAKHSPIGNWPTPRAGDGHHGGPNSRDSSGRYAPSGAVNHAEPQNWPTPRANDGEKRGNIADDPRNGLPSAVENLWPTPQARDYRSPDSPDSPRLQRKKEQGWSPNLNDVVANWPTPQAGDDRDRGNLSNPVVQRRIEKGKQVNLSICASTESGKLNPDWVEALMGFPIGWTDIGGLLDTDYRSSTGSRPAWWPEECPSELTD